MPIKVTATKILDTAMFSDDEAMLFDDTELVKLINEDVLGFFLDGATWIVERLETEK